MPEARAAGARLGVRVICGCEFSVRASWGEMHLLGYFLPLDSPELDAFLERCRDMRRDRAAEMVTRLRGAGAVVRMDQVLAAAGTGAIGRPHVARAMVEAGIARSIAHAFDRWIGWGRPAFVPKVLPPFAEVAELVHRAGGIVSAAHLKDRGTRATLERLHEEGLDAVETRHPSHDPETRARITDLAAATGLLRTGGSDWHGGPGASGSHGALGGQQVPAAWLDALAGRAVEKGTGRGHYHVDGSG